MTIQAIQPTALKRAWRLPLGAIILLFFLLLSAYMLSLQFPWRFASANAATDIFSAERAMSHLPRIASAPHPAGSPQQAVVRQYLSEQLAQYGLPVETQPFGPYKNLIVRLPGSDPTGALVILAHYDSAPNAPGAADNGAGVAVLLEVARILSASSPLRNDVILLFDDAEEIYPPFAGARAFAQSHPWMRDLRVAISLDTAVAGPIQINDSVALSRGLVQALAAVHREGWIWSSAGGDGNYDSLPFKQAGVQTLAIEDNYAFRVQHTALDRPEIVRYGSVQQLGDQTLALARQVGGMDLNADGGAPQSFFAIPIIGLFYYPLSWTQPLAVLAAILVFAALVLAMARRAAGWRGLIIGLAATFLSVLLSGMVSGLLWERIPGWLGWRRADWPLWPEIVPPNAGWILLGFTLLSLAIAFGLYQLARRWSSCHEIGLAALIPYALMSLAFPQADLRLAILPIWPALVGSVVWLVFLTIPALRRQSLDLPLCIAAGVFAIHFPAVIVMSFLSSGPSDIAILMALWVALLFILLPALDAIVDALRGPQTERAAGTALVN